MNEIFDIFISYRRIGGGNTAKQLYHWLADNEGYSTFFDVQSLREGRWEENLLKHLKQCKDFILIVDANAFTKTINEEYPQGEDWMRMEIAKTLERVRDNKEDVGIIPIILPDAEFPTKGLPQDIESINGYNAITIDKIKDFFNDDCRAKIIEFLHSKPTKVLKEQYINPTPMDQERFMNLIQQNIQRGILTIVEMGGMKATFNQKSI